MTRGRPHKPSYQITFEANKTVSLIDRVGKTPLGPIA